MLLGEFAISKKIIHWCNKVFEKSKSKQNIIYETPQKHRGRTRKEMWNEIIIRNGEAKNQSIPRIFFILVIKLVAFHERKLLHTRLCPGNRFKKPAHPMKVNETTSVSRPNSTLEKIFYLDHSCLHLPYYLYSSISRVIWNIVFIIEVIVIDFLFESLLYWSSYWINA